MIKKNVKFLQIIIIIFFPLSVNPLYLYYLVLLIFLLSKPLGQPKESFRKREAFGEVFTATVDAAEERSEGEDVEETATKV